MGDGQRKTARQTKRPSRKSVTVLVRPMRLSDFEFVRDLSAKIDGYTVPPLYVLWMLREFHAELCLIAESSRKERLGYMLAMATGLNSRRLFIWQFASTFQGQRILAATSFAKQVQKLVKKYGIKELVFTAEPNSGATRSIRRLSKQIFERTPRPGSRLPRAISQREQEYYIFV